MAKAMMSVTANVLGERTALLIGSPGEHSLIFQPVEREKSPVDLAGFAAPKA
jgi:hypothetical protein